VRLILGGHGRCPQPTGEPLRGMKIGPPVVRSQGNGPQFLP
jgi:hypothetical protein